MEVTESSVNGEYKLSRRLVGHGNDVKCLAAALDMDVLVSGSRDQHVRLWSADEVICPAESNDAKLDAFVNSVVFYPPGKPEMVIAGTNSGSIFVLTAPELKVEHKIKAHKTNVCTLSVCERSDGTPLLISGSWDNTASIWPLKSLEPDVKPLLKLEGHEGSVWSAISLGLDDRYATGSADTSIKIWIGAECARTIPTGEGNVIRSLVCLSSDIILGAGNDTKIRQWNVNTGECLDTLQSTGDSFIYSLTLACTSSDDSGVRMALSASEGGLVELWAVTTRAVNPDAPAASACHPYDVTPLQQLRAPAHSVWDAVVLANNDVAAACSDGNIWLFTLDAGRLAPAELQSDYETSMAAFVTAVADQPQDNKTIVIKVDVEDGKPPLDLSYKIGEDPWASAQRFIQQHKLPTHFTNQVADFIVANVPAARQSTRVQPAASKVTHDGQQWDYVFDIGVDDGRSLKLPYNVDEDPWMAAQRFLDKNGLPIQFLEKVANFIRDQMVTTAGATAADPFTGGDRYVPGASGSGAGALADCADPFTGGGRYVPGSAAVTNGSASGDPFTSAGRYVPGSAADDHLMANVNRPKDKLRPRGELVPLRDMIRFGREHAAAAEKVGAKLTELNAAQADPSVKLTDDELQALTSFIGADTTGSLDIHIAALEKALTWHMDHMVPVLDVFRIALLYQDVVKYFMNAHTDRGTETMQLLQNLLLSDPPLGVRVMACRAIANACAHRLGQALVVECMADTVTLLLPGLALPKPLAQKAVASCLANFALVLMQRVELDKSLLLLLQACVTLLWGDKAAVKQAVKLGLPGVIARIKDACPGDNSKIVARDLQTMFEAV